jgi:Trk K+ transport system NAD-binding subunit
VIARLRYRLDQALARGALMVMGYLAALTLAITLVAAGILTALHLSGVNGGPKLGFAEAFWQSLLRMLGKGAFAADQEWTTRALNLVVTLAGIFLAGALIALISAAVNQRIARLRRGRSPVLETGHTLVLGWSPRLPVILSELVIANADRRRAAVVVLANKVQDEMEDELHKRVPHTRNTRVVCRTGDPGRQADLDLVNVHDARSIIVLNGEDGDAGVVRAVLAVRGFENDAGLRIVAELNDAVHAAALRALTDNAVVTVQGDAVIGQVTAQACFQDGLAAVFRELLGFEGSELHIRAIPDLVGHTYRDAIHAFNQCAVVGVCRDGVVTLNPAGDAVFTAEDRVVVIAADELSVLFTGLTPAPADAGAAASTFMDPVEHIALVGWSSLGTKIVSDLDRVLGSGSVIDVLVDPAYITTAEVTLPPVANIKVDVHELGDGPTAVLEMISAHSYDHAIVLSYRNELSAEQADALTLLMLLTLHKARATGAVSTRVVAEMRDRANVAIARTIEVDDFIVSDELSSLMLAQVSERRELDAVFRGLFDGSGCVLTLRPASLYAGSDEATWASAVSAAAQRGESAIGYRLGETATVVNPAKTARLVLGPNDRVLVLARRSRGGQDPQPRLFAGGKLDVSAERLPHGREQLVGVDGLATAAEPGEQ